jgi:O-Antigen ligase
MTETFYRHALAVLAVTVFFTNVPTFLNIVNNVPTVYWVSGCLLLSLPVLIREALRTDILKSPLVLWCFGYAWVAVIWFFLSSQSDMTWQELRWRFLAILELVMFLVIFASPEATKWARLALVAPVLVGVAINVYEIFAPMTFSKEMGRSAGLYVNPNQSGEALVSGMLLSVAALPAMLRVPFILLTGLGVFTTFSRGAMLGWAVVGIGLLFTGTLSLKHVALSGAIGLLLIIAIVLPRADELLTALDRSGMSTNKDVAERLEWFANPSGVSDNSSWERAYLAKQAWDKTADHPLLGSGTGASRETIMGTHNQYLMFMQDHGVWAAAILPLLVLAVTWGARGEVKTLGIIFGITVLLRGFFSHDILNQPFDLILFALMAAMAAVSRERTGERVHVLAQTAMRASGTVA